MRILWLSHLLPWPPKGGLSQRSYHLMREIGRRNDLHIVAFTQAAQQKSEAARFEATEALSEFATVEAVHPLPENILRGGRNALAVSSLFPGPPYTIRWGISPEYRKSVRDAVREFRPQVVHFDTVSLAPYLDDIANIPAVLNHHNIESHMLARRAAQDTNLARRCYFQQEARRLERYERQVAGRFASHLVCSELDIDRLEENTGQLDTRVVPNGVDLNYFTPAKKENMESGSLVFVGGLSWYPNASAIRFFLAEVWPLLTAERPEVRLRVVGRGAPENLKRTADRDSRIEFPGFVDDMRPVVHRSNIYICPIRDGGGTKLKMLDAMALGKAIVAHPVACEGLKTTDGVNVLEANNAEAFARQIIRLMDDPDLRRTLEANARAHVESHFSFEAIGADLSMHYASLV